MGEGKRGEAGLSALTALPSPLHLCLSSKQLLPFYFITSRCPSVKMLRHKEVKKRASGLNAWLDSGLKLHFVYCLTLKNTIWSLVYAPNAMCERLPYVVAIFSAPSEATGEHLCTLLQPPPLPPYLATPHLPPLSLGPSSPKLWSFLPPIMVPRLAAS